MEHDLLLHAHPELMEGKEMQGCAGELKPELPSSHTELQSAAAINLKKRIPGTFATKKSEEDHSTRLPIIDLPTSQIPNHRISSIAMNADTAAATVADDEIIYELSRCFRVYRSGRVERLLPASSVPPSLDPATGVDSKDVIINPSSGLSVRLYLPPSAASGRDRKLPVLVQFHGGGFSVLSTSHPLCHNYVNSLTAKAGVLTVSVEYRLAPENPIPAAYEDGLEAVRWVSSHAGGGCLEPWLSKFGDLEKIFLGGESAGGNIAHNVAMMLGREGKKVEGVVLLCPGFWGKERIGSENDQTRGSERKPEELDGLWPIIYPRMTGLDDPCINPVADGGRSLAALGCRRALIYVAELDLLVERGRIYFEKLKESGWGGEAEFMETVGKGHCFFLFDPSTEKAEEFFERVAGFLNRE
ncbi:putative carboxylesterase 2 [Apostasia shenzhenica]|uniref:Putative carboxylesterase 2 n=1 Tax=Apostasia shenzhenica TaxID=1088818 RepID=A0A2H9ZSZ6_9ASPA|nr:putative carboxylesterase 2 [Apostasia shenzhenica]